MFGFILLLVSVSTAFAVNTPSPSPSPIASPKPFSSYEVFWPLTPGKVSGEPFYFLKLLKESLREFFTFSDYRKGDYNIILSEKRAVEVEKLFLEKKDYVNARRTLDDAQRKRERVLFFMQKTRDKGKEVKNMVTRMISSLENQRALFELIVLHTPESEKQVLVNDIEGINKLLDQLRMQGQ